ncbi:EpsG family protein [Shewanella xiamenensis]|uniref:EpsG family protein n=1 Tax=Shewanella xiamenensis TaxID=332186 RepID=UPI003CC7A348
MRLVVSYYSLISFAISLIVIFISTFRGPDFFPDTYNYIQYLSSNMLLERFEVEYTFKLISSFISSLGLEYGFLFLFYTSLSIMLKLSLFSHFKDKVFIFIFFLSTSLILHDLIQIRVGLAISFSLYSIYVFFNGKFLLSVFMYTLAVSFHYSTLILFPFLIFNYLLINKRSLIVYLYLFLPFSILSSGFISENFLTTVVELIFPQLYSKLILYTENINTESVNLFSLKLLFIYLYLILSYPHLTKMPRFELFSVLMVIEGVILLVIFRSNLGLALRLSDIFLSFLVFVVSFIRINNQKNLLIYMLLPAIYILINVYYNLVLLKLL